MVNRGKLVNNCEKGYRRRRRIGFFHTTSASLPDVQFFNTTSASLPGRKYFRNKLCWVHGGSTRNFSLEKLGVCCNFFIWSTNDDLWSLQFKFHLPTDSGAWHTMPVLKQYRGPSQLGCLGNISPKIRTIGRLAALQGAQSLLLNSAKLNKAGRFVLILSCSYFRDIRVAVFFFWV